MGKDERMKDLQEEWDHQKLHGAPRYPSGGGGSGCFKFIVIVVLLLVVGAVIFALLSGQSLNDVLGVTSDPECEYAFFRIIEFNSAA